MHINKSLCERMCQSSVGASSLLVMIFCYFKNFNSFSSAATIVIFGSLEVPPKTYNIAKIHLNREISNKCMR